MEGRLICRSWFDKRQLHRTINEAVLGEGHGRTCQHKIPDPLEHEIEIVPGNVQKDTVDDTADEHGKTSVDTGEETLGRAGTARWSNVAGNADRRGNEETRVETFRDLKEKWEILPVAVGGGVGITKHTNHTGNKG